MPLDASSDLRGTQLRGRDAELRRLRGALARADGGEPATVLVTGPPGVGKTRLVAEALAGGDRVVLRAGGDEAEADLEYGILEQLLRDVPRGLARAAPAPPGRAAEPLRAGAELLAMIDAFRLERPLVIAVDDAQWADVPSLQALAFAARRLRADPVALCVTCRDEGVKRLPPGLVRVADASGGRIALGGLDRAAVADLARERLGRPLSDSAARRLAEHTSGVPQHLLALLTELTYDELNAATPLPAPSSYAALVLGQLAACSPDAERLAAALAVFGSPAPLADVAQTADVEEPLAHAEELVRHQLVGLERTVTGTAIAFAHDLVAASVAGDLSPARRAAMHGRAAELAAGTDALRHRLAAASGPAPALVREACEAADAAASAGARRRAAGLLLAAAPRAAGARERERLVLQAAMELLAAGAPPGELPPGIASFEPSAEREFVLGRSALVSGGFAEAERSIASAWAALEQRDGTAPLAGPVADTLAICAEHRADYAAVATWARRALAAGSTSMSSATMLAFGLAVSESPPAAAAAMLDVLASGPGPVLELDARLGLAIARVYSNELEAAEADLRAVLRTPLVRESLLVATNARCYLAELCSRAGRWSEALDLAEGAASIVDDAEQLFLAALPHGIAASVLAHSGELERAREHAAVASETAAVVGLVPARLWATHAELRIADAAADHDGVAALADRIAAEGWRMYPEWVHRWRASAAESLLALGRVEDAAALAGELAAEAEAGTDVAAAADHARAAAALAAAGDDDEAAERRYADGLALDPDGSRPFERARLELAAGAHLRRRGRRRDAAALLGAAAERLRGLGAAPWLERSERELAACGLRPAKRSEPWAGQSLTPQERLVARLVAAGRTNREVAAELVLSEKTIEHHLSRIYRKLGVRSRTELAAHLGRGK